MLHFWDAQVATLSDAGYRAVAPNQRGYAAGARPDPADHAQHRIDLLIAGALAIVARLGNPPASISPATIGAAASPGTLPTSIPTVSPP